MQEKEPLPALINKVCAELEKEGYTENSVRFYREHFARMLNIAGEMGLQVYTDELGRAFRADCNYVNTNGKADKICLPRQRYHNRCVIFIESFLKEGSVDCTYRYKPLLPTSLSPNFAATLSDFKNQMERGNLSSSTIKQGVRFVGYFLEYLQGIGCASFAQVKNGDICRFISFICEDV